MLTEYKDVRPKKDVRSPLKMFATQSRNFFKEGAPKHAIFKQFFFFFSGRIILKDIENKSSSMSVRGQALPENV